MVLFNYSTKELTAKVVYYGPGLCGKTTNLQWIHEKLPIKNKGKMLSLATEADRTLFFDFLPIELGSIRGMKTRIQLYTVPGQVFYNATRRMVLKGADCVVFVADSQERMLDANLDAAQNLRENLEANEIDAAEIPTVLQYNKRDLPNALPIEILNEKLNPKGLPYFEAVAMKGIGVEETLKGATTLVFRALATKYGGAEGSAATTTAPVRPAPPSAVSASSAPSASPRRAPTSTLPPVARASRPAVEEEIDLELPVATEGEEFALPSDETEEISLSVDEEPAVMARTDTDPRIKAKNTLVRGGDEAADLRRRISQPLAEPELSLEAIDEEDVEIEELTLDEPPAPPPARPAAAPRPAPAAVRPSAPAPAAVAPPPRAPAAAPARAAPVVPAPVASAVRPAPSRPPAPPAVSAPAMISTAPVSVQLSGSPGRTDIAIPVEVILNNGTAQVQINLRLTLNLKLQG
jgi:signal recognition particle receptor subunit beta